MRLVFLALLQARVKRGAGSKAPPRGKKTSRRQRTQVTVHDNNNDDNDDDDYSYEDYDDRDNDPDYLGAGGAATKRRRALTENSSNDVYSLTVYYDYSLSNSNSSFVLPQYF